MSEEHKIYIQESGRVLVILHPTCEITKEEILALLAECGFAESDVTFLIPEEVGPDLECEGLPFLIPIDANVYENPELEDVARLCANNGGTVVTILGPNISYDKLHPIAEKYGPQCTWSGRELQSCIGTPLTTSPTTTSGAVVERGPKDPVKC